MSTKKRKDDEAGTPEGGRRTTGGAPAEVLLVQRGAEPEQEVIAGAQRRKFTASYKLRILEEADRCQMGEIAALLRREGLFYSHLQNWKDQRTAGTLSGLSPKQRGPKKRKHENDEMKRLKRENERLKKKLNLAEEIIEFQKKIAAILDHGRNDEI